LVAHFARSSDCFTGNSFHGGYLVASEIPYGLGLEISSSAHGARKFLPQMFVAHICRLAAQYRIVVVKNAAATKIFDDVFNAVDDWRSS
jgi:hypothetical protein